MQRSNYAPARTPSSAAARLIRLAALPLALTMMMSLALPGVRPVQAEGSRETVAGGGKRALTEWRTNTTAGLYRRTFLRVYAEAGESILMGSSAVGVGSGDIVLYREIQISSSQVAPGTLSTITPAFTCSAYRVSHGGAGELRTRAQELAGPLGNTGGYTPCIYTAPATETYWVAMYGPDGASGITDGTAGTIDTPVVDATQRSGVSMWDVTVRRGDPLTGSTRAGRVFVDYLAQITGGNGVDRRMYSRLYAVTTDGYVYQVDLNGLDPNGYIFYGNRVGFLDPDGRTPLYHDLVYTENTLSSPVGGTIRPAASARIFFSNPLDSGDLPASILPTPEVPSIDNVTYEGSANGNTGYQNVGGTFRYTGNVGGISEIVIQGSGSTDYEPDNPLNRRLLSESVIGTNAIAWDGRDNRGTAFPVGNGYSFRVTFHAGEYHFPLLDAENSVNGGPTITFLNPIGGVCPFNANCHTAFYDDRVYRVSTGAVVPIGGTVGNTLPGNNPPATNHSDQNGGFDTSTTQRAWGATSSSGFGDWKGLDLWTYFPVSAVDNILNVIAPAAGQDLRIVKTHSGPFGIGSNAGTFTITITNVGGAALTSFVMVDDFLPSGMTLYQLPYGTGWSCSTWDNTQANCLHQSDNLAPGASLPSLTVPVNVNNWSATSLTNYSSHFAETDTNPANNESSDTVTIIGSDLEIAKTNDAVGEAGIGLPFNWTLAVSNTGSGPAVFQNGQVLVSDPLPAGADYGTVTVDSFVGVTNPGAVTCTVDGSRLLTCTASGSAVTLAAEYGSFRVTIPVTPTAAGPLANTATVDPNSVVAERDETNNSASDSLTVYTPSLGVTKISTAVAVTAAGQVIPYSFSAANTGTMALTGITVSDPRCDAAPVYQSGDTNGDSRLDVTETWLYTCQHTVTQAEMDAGGNLTNTVTADSTQTSPVTDVLDIPVSQAPGLQVEKTSSTASISSAGQVVPYTFVVSNTGNISLSGVVVSDARCDASPAYQSGDGDGDGRLDLSETWTYTCSHTVAQEEIDAGGNLTNTATADSNESEPDQATLDIPVIQAPGLAVSKSSMITLVVSAWQVVPYTIVVTNTGNMSLSLVTVSDPMCDTAPAFLGGDPDGDGRLDLAEAWLYGCEHTVTQAEIDAGGNLSNTVTANSAEAGPETAILDIPVLQNPNMNLMKNSATPLITGAGQLVDYSFAVTNTGNRTLSGVIVSDPLCDAAPVYQSGDTNSNGLLDLTEIWIFACTHTVTQAEMDAGGLLTNTAAADSTETLPVEASHDIPVQQSPGLYVGKSSTTTEITTAGQIIPYTFTLSNTGNISLSGVWVSDTRCDAAPVYQSGDTNTDNRLDLNETWTYACTRTVDQTMVNGGGTWNNVVLAGSNETPTAVDSLDIPIRQAPGISLAKTSATTAVTTAGQVVGYTLVVSNTGNITLSGITVMDALCDAPPTYQSGDVDTDGLLDVDEAWTYSCGHTVTQAEMDAGGNLTNAASASSAEAGPAGDSVDIPIQQAPGIQVVKNSGVTLISAAGQVVPYTFTVTNTGNVTLSGVMVSDPLCDAAPAYQSGDASADTLLDLTESWTYTCNHTVTQDELNAGPSLANTVTADSVESGTDEDTLTIPVLQNPGIHVVKSTTVTLVTTAGQSVPYQFIVTNTGNISLSAITVEDAHCDEPPAYISGDTDGDALLDLTEIWEYTCTRTVTRLEVESGGLLNNTVTADSAESGPASDSLSIPVTVYPSLGLAKRLVSSVEVSAGTWRVTYELLARNSSGLTLSNLQVRDDLTNTFDTPTTFRVISTASAQFTVNPVYDGVLDTSLLTGGDALQPHTEGTVSIVLEVVPARSGPFNNSATASAAHPNNYILEDTSQDGTNPDPDGDGNPTNNGDPTPVSFPGLFDPLDGVKTVDASGMPNLAWTVVWINNANIIPVAAAAHDPIPAGTTYLASGADSGIAVPVGAPAGSTNVGVTCSGGGLTTSSLCYYEGPTPAHPRGQVIWEGTLSPDFGVSDPAAAQNAITIRFSTTVAGGTNYVRNTATADSDLNGDGDTDDAGEEQAASASAAWNSPEPTPAELPQTGFAANVVTTLTSQPDSQTYTNLGELWLEIPRLGVQAAIVGVPQSEAGGWNVGWLGTSAGWLNGTAFPTLAGNSVITAHVYDANGKPGPFIDLGNLRYGDQIILHYQGQKYIYEVRALKLVKPEDTRTVMQHQDLPYLSLLTCRGYDEENNLYRYRVLVRAVQVKIE